MLTGLFMACFLVGALWFVIGIGDAVVFRDRMQEATDNAVFASAALHAKGMNFISLCNLVMLAAVTIHIILGIIHDIALAICIVSFGTGCGFWGAMRQVYTNYFNVLKPALQAVHVGEMAASYAYPVLGVVEGLQHGKTYSRGNKQVTVLALSASLVPGRVGSASVKEGLPVEVRPMSFLCKKAVGSGFNALFNTALGISGQSVGGKVIDVVQSIIGTVIEARYCNDLGSSSDRLSQQKLGKSIGDGNKSADAQRNDGKTTQTQSGSSSGGLDPGFDAFWGKDGPLVVFDAARNGNEWFQVYGLNVAPELDDPSEGHVALAQGPNTFAKYTKTEQPLGYFAQAEFYFDCNQRWLDENCNYENNASFSIKWRARLRRVELPNLERMLAGVGIEALIRLTGLDQFKKVQAEFGKKLGSILGGRGVVGRTVVRGFLEFLGRSGTNAARDVVNANTNVPALNTEVLH